MPKVIIDPSKGLITQAGSGFELKSGVPVTLAGTLSGQRTQNDTTISSDTTLTTADSGKVFIIGDSSAQPQATYTIQFPVDVAGWNAKFYLTGNIRNDIIVSGASATTTGTPVAIFDTIITRSVGITGKHQAITSKPSLNGTGSTELTFVATGSHHPKGGGSHHTHYGDQIEIVVGIANSVVFATGLAGSGSM